MSWSPPLPATQNGIITGYTVRLSYPGGANILRNTATSQATFSSLVSGTVYSVSVAARNSVGLGPYSAAQRFTSAVTGKRLRL